MERLRWAPYGTGYYNFDVWYNCPKCQHEFDKVTHIPPKCPTCNVKLNNVRSLIADNNQDIRVKHFAGNAV